jgi:hypothetical protein
MQAPFAKFTNCSQFTSLALEPLTLAPLHMQMHIRVVEDVVGRLLMAACADGSIAVRRAILQSIQEPSSLDIYLAQADA